MKQSDKVLQHMKRRGSITSAEAIDLYGITRLSARIWELKRKGVKIKSVDVPVMNRYGSLIHVARYSLAGGTTHETD